VHADDGLQKRDLILQLFHAVFGSQRLEQKLLAFCEAIDLRPDIALENDLENMGDLLIILIFKHNNYLGFIRM